MKGSAASQSYGIIDAVMLGRIGSGVYDFTCQSMKEDLRRTVCAEAHDAATSMFGGAMIESGQCSGFDRRLKSLQKFASVHANGRHPFN